jgi:hypothetical protein
MTLTNKNIKIGLQIRNINHPEWGVKIVTQDRNGYNWRDNRGEAILIPSEYHFWEIVR